MRAHATLFLDLSFTLLRYAGTSLDADIRWVMQHLDQRMVVGSDMPEFTPAQAFARARDLAGDIGAGKWPNMAHGNLDRAVFRETSRTRMTAGSTRAASMQTPTLPEGGC